MQRHVLSLSLLLWIVCLGSSAFASARPCTELPPVAWNHAPKARVDVVVTWHLDRVPSAKDLYLNALCGAQPSMVWNLVNRGEGAVVALPDALARSLDVATPHLPRVDYMYVRGGGADREIVVVLFANGYAGPFFRFDENVAWREDEVRRAETIWNATPYEFMRRASHWLHDVALFRNTYTVHTELFGGLIKIPVFTMPDGRALASPLGSIFAAREAGPARLSPADMDVNMWLHELAHYNHYYLSGMNALPWPDAFTSISRENMRLLGIPVPFWFVEKYPETHAYDCQSYTPRPFGYVTHYARCGEMALVEDFADTLSVAIGTTQYFQKKILEGDRLFGTYRDSGAFDYNLDYLYARGSDPDGSVMGRKLMFMRDTYSYHLHEPQDADGNGITWKHGQPGSDCDDRNPVVGACEERTCRTDRDCDDGDACTIDTCAGAVCVHTIRDSDGDGSPDGACGGNDCDDHNPSIHAGSTRPCANDCGIEGVETCLDGAWSACSAPASCECLPGEVDFGPCGYCGIETHTCGDDGAWSTGACEGSKQCAPGSTEVVSCGVRQCARRSIPMVRTNVCSATCGWVEGPCQLTEPTEPEICDGIDNDCNGRIDEACPAGLVFTPSAQSGFIGGNGGPTILETNCPAGQVLVGMAMHQGTYTAPFYSTKIMAGLRPVCGKVELRPDTARTPHTYTVTFDDGATLAPHGSYSYAHGLARCPAGMGITGIGYKTGWYVDRLQFHCGSLDIAGSRGNYSLVRNRTHSTQVYWDSTAEGHYRCPGTRGFVTGIRTRTGKVVDAIGINCSDASLTLR